MNCLNNFIGVRRGCDPVKSKSNLYVDDLPGISLNNIASINDGKYISAQEMIESKLQLVGEVMQQEFQLSIMDIWQFDLAIESGVGGSYLSDYSALAGEHGLVVKMINSNLRVVVLNSLILDFEEDFSKEITITDGVEELKVNEELKVISIAGTRTEIPINFVSQNGYVKVTFDGDGLTGREGTTKDTYFNRDCGRCGKPGYESFTIRGLLDGSEVKEIKGMVGRVTVDCSIDKAFCLSIHNMKTAILYRLGVMLLEEWLASSRMNWMTIHGKEWAEATIPQWNAKAMELMGVIVPQVGNFLKKVDKNCLKCGGISYVQAHP